MSTRQHFTTEQARKFGDKFGIDWDWSHSDIEQFHMGLDIELEYGLHATPKVVTGNASNHSGKIMFTFLNEFADYHSRLEKLEGEAREENIESIKLGYICWRKAHSCSSMIHAHSKNKLK